MNGSDGRDTLDKIEDLERMGFKVVQEWEWQKWQRRAPGGGLVGGSDPWELVKELEARVVTVQGINDGLSDRVKGLESDIIGHRSSQSQCSRAVEELRELANERRDKVKRLEGVIEQNELKIVGLDQTFSDQRKTIEHLQRDNNQLNTLAGGYKNERDIVNEGYRNQKKEIDNLTILYTRYRITAHKLYAMTNKIQRLIGEEMKMITVAFTAEEWNKHFPEGLYAGHFLPDDFFAETEVEGKLTAILNPGEGFHEFHAATTVEGIDFRGHDPDEATESEWDEAVEEVLDEHSDVWETLADHDREEFNKLVRGIISERMTEVGKEMERYEEALHNDPSDDFPSWGRMIQAAVKESDE